MGSCITWPYEVAYHYSRITWVYNKYTGTLLVLPHNHQELPTIVVFTTHVPVVFLPSRYNFRDIDILYFHDFHTADKPLNLRTLVYKNKHFLYLTFL